MTATMTARDNAILAALAIPVGVAAAAILTVAALGIAVYYGCIGVAAAAKWWFDAIDPLYEMPHNRSTMTQEGGGAVPVADWVPTTTVAYVMTQDTFSGMANHVEFCCEQNAVLALPHGEAIEAPADEEVCVTAANSPVRLYDVRRRILRDEYQRGTPWILEACGCTFEEVTDLRTFWQDRGWELIVRYSRRRS